MTDTISIRGAIVIASGSCGGCSTDGTSKPLGLGGASCCDASVSYDEAIPFHAAIATPGAVGQSFVDLPELARFTAIEFFRLVSSAPVQVRLNASRPQLVATVAIPVGGVTAGAATFIVTDANGVQYPATVAFTGATNTPALVVSAINGALAGAGASFPPDGPIARLGVGGLLYVVNPGIGPLAFVDLAVGAPAGLGLGTAHAVVAGTAQTMPATEGLVVLQFPRSPNAPTRIQVSGTASLDIIAAGRVTA